MLQRQPQNVLMSMTGWYVTERSEVRGEAFKQGWVCFLFFIYIYIYSVRAEWRKRMDWLLIKLYYPELVYDLFSYYMLCYIYNYSINLYSLNYWHWRLYCAEGEIAEFSSVYICKLLCNKGWFLLWGFFVCSGVFFLKRFIPAFKLHCSTSAFISAEPRSFGFSVPLETVVES